MTNMRCARCGGQVGHSVVFNTDVGSAWYTITPCASCLAELSTRVCGIGPGCGRVPLGPEQVKDQLDVSRKQYEEVLHEAKVLREKRDKLKEECAGLRKYKEWCDALFKTITGLTGLMLDKGETHDS